MMRFARLKIAVFAPMPSAKVATATTVKLEDLRSLRNPRAKSSAGPSSLSPPSNTVKQFCGPGSVTLKSKPMKTKYAFYRNPPPWKVSTDVIQSPGANNPNWINMRDKCPWWLYHGKTGSKNCRNQMG
jgi:hypothetical protein